LLVSVDEDEYDQGVHITMPYDDMIRASAALIIITALVSVELGLIC